MADPKLVLYGDTFWISPYFFSCFVAMTEKELPFTVERVALEARAQRGADYARLSVTARVPALLHDGFGLAESSAIVEYLDDVFPARRVLPEGAQDRARARQLMSWIRSDDTLPLRQERPTTSMFYERATAPLSDAARRSAEKVVEVAERCLAGDRPSLFSSYSIADSELAFLLQRLLMNGHALPPALAAFVKREWARPSVRAFVVRERPPYVAY